MSESFVSTQDRRLQLLGSVSGCTKGGKDVNFDSFTQTDDRELV
jgi:hypothetical protein